MLRTSGPALPSGRRSGVDREDRPLRRARRAEPDQAAGQRRCRRDAAGSSSLVARAGLADEDDVDVAGVVELARAALAHRDDREPDVRGVPGRAARAWRGQGRFQRRRARIGEPASATSSIGTSPVRSRAAIASSRRRWARRSWPPGRPSGARSRSSCSPRGRALRQDPPVAAMAGQMIAERGTGAEHTEQTRSGAATRPGAAPASAAGSESTSRASVASARSGSSRRTRRRRGFPRKVELLRAGRRSASASAPWQCSAKPIDGRGTAPKNRALAGRAHGLHAGGTAPERPPPPSGEPRRRTAADARGSRGSGRARTG